MKVAILDDYQRVALDMTDWSRIAARAEIDVFSTHLGGPDAVVEALQPYDVIVAMRERTPFPRETLERLSNLRLLVTTGTVNAAIDMRACADLGVTVSGTRVSGGTTTELTWALILAAVRRLDIELASVRAGGWMTTLGTGLAGRTLGVLGLGRIGGQVATIGQAFGMDVLSWSEHLTERRCAEVGARLVEREELFREADILSIHLVLSERTWGLVGERELRLMKPTAWLVNTSRGSICEEAALTRACEERWIAGAVLDVYSEEPLPLAHPFRRIENVLATPHIGYVTQETYAMWFSDVVEDITAFADGSPIRVLRGIEHSSIRM